MIFKWQIVYALLKAKVLKLQEQYKNGLLSVKLMISKPPSRPSTRVEDQIKTVIENNPC